MDHSLGLCSATQTLVMQIELIQCMDTRKNGRNYVLLYREKDRSRQRLQRSLPVADHFE